MNSSLDEDNQFRKIYQARQDSGYKQRANIQSPIFQSPSSRNEVLGMIKNSSSIKYQAGDKSEVYNINKQSSNEYQQRFQTTMRYTRDNTNELANTVKDVQDDKKQPFDFDNNNVEVLENGQLRFKDIREDILTKKVEKALSKVQQIDNQKYALKLLARFTHTSMNRHLNKYQKTVIKDVCLPENNTFQIGHSLNQRMGNKDDDDQKLSFIERFIASIPLFNPSNTFLIVWDIFQLIFILFFFYAIPLQIVFNLGLGKFLSDTIFNLGACLFLIDNLLCINTTYFEKGVPIKDRQLIWQHYLRKHFVTDFLSNIPVLIDYFVANLKGVWGLIMLIQYLKVDRITIIIRKVEERFNLSLQQQQLVRLAKLLFRVLFVAHIFSCIWLYLALNNTDDVDIWLQKFDYDKKTWQEQFLVSYYFTTVTMITVGYGDFAPLNNREFVFCIFTMLIACGVFAYAVNQIGSIFENIGKQEKQMKEMMYSISSYMHLKKVSKELQYQIREYLQYYWTEQQDRDTEIEEKIKNQLSDNLKDQLALEANNIVLKDSVVFKNNFSNSVISKTVPLIKEYRATPEEIILIENTLTEDQNIYFIEKGQVEVYLSQSDQPLNIQKLNSGDCFGQVGFFTGFSRLLSVRSLDFTTLIYIKRSDFLDLLKEFPEDYEQFCYIRDKILNESDYRLIGMKCYSCKDGKHLSHNCPFLHYSPKKLLLLKKFFYPGQQNREKHQRKKVKKGKNCLKETEALKEKAEEIQEQYSLIIDDLFGDDDFFDSSESKQDDDDDEDNDESDDQSDIPKIPSYLCQNQLQAKMSIDKFFENQTPKIEECQISSEDSLPTHSNRKIIQPQNYSISQSLHNQDQKDETTYPVSQQDKTPRQSSMNQTPIIQNSESRNIELSWSNQGWDGESSDYTNQKSSHLIPTKDKKKRTLINNKKELLNQPSQNIKESLNSQYFNPSSNSNIPPLNLQGSKIDLNKPLRSATRQDSRRKSSKKQQMPHAPIIPNFPLSQQQQFGIKGIKEETIVSRQLSSQTSKFESKQKFIKQSTLNKADQVKGSVQTESQRNILADLNNINLLQKLQEIIGSNQPSRKDLNDEEQIIIQGSDNQTNFYGLDEFDALKNFTFYYPSHNAEYIIEKCMKYQNFKVRQPNFLQLNKLKPNVQPEKQPVHQMNQVDIIRKSRKTGGTRIIAGGGVTGNLINKFRQLEEAQGGSLDEDSQGGNNSPVESLTHNNSQAENSPFSRAAGRKTTKRMNIINTLGMPFQQQDSLDQKDSPINVSKSILGKKSRFQYELPTKINEDISESFAQDKFSEKNHQFDRENSKSSSRNYILDETSQSKALNIQEDKSMYGNTFSLIPSTLSINENGNLPTFQNFQYQFKSKQKQESSFLYQ